MYPFKKIIHLILIVKMNDIQIIQKELAHLIKTLHYIVNDISYHIITSYCHSLHGAKKSYL